MHQHVGVPGFYEAMRCNWNPLDGGCSIAWLDTAALRQQLTVSRRSPVASRRSPVARHQFCFASPHLQKHQESSIDGKGSRSTLVPTRDGLRARRSPGNRKPATERWHAGRPSVASHQFASLALILKITTSPQWKETAQEDHRSYARRHAGPDISRKLETGI